MEKQNILSDAWVVEGVNDAEFLEIVEDLSERTKYLSFNSKELEVLSFFDYPDENSYLCYFIITEDFIEQLELAPKLIKEAKKYPLDRISPYEEDFRNTGIILRKENYWMSTSRKLLEDIVSVNLNLIPIGYARALTLMHSLRSEDSIKKFIVRHDEKNIQKKAFVCVGGRYCYTPQIDFFEEAGLSLEEQLPGICEPARYRVTNDISEQWYKIKNPVINTVEAGIYFATSDTCQCSYTIGGYVKVGDSYNTVTEVCHQHSRIDLIQFFSSIRPVYNAVIEFLDELKSLYTKKKRIFEKLRKHTMRRNAEKYGISKKELIEVFPEDDKEDTIGVQVVRFLALPEKMSTNSSKEKFEKITIKSLADVFKEECSYE